MSEPLAVVTSLIVVALLAAVLLHYRYHTGRKVEVLEALKDQNVKLEVWRLVTRGGSIVYEVTGTVIGLEGRLVPRVRLREARRADGQQSRYVAGLDRAGVPLHDIRVVESADGNRVEFYRTSSAHGS